MADDDGLPELPDEPPPLPADRPELRIVDFAEVSRPKARRCSVCGEEREPYIEVEVDGRPEATCRSCYESSVRVALAVASCRGCGTPLGPADRFCGKCGAPAEKTCPSCHAPARDEDTFCAKCGTRLLA